MENDKNQESFRDRISTVDDAGKRRWIYPKKPKGKLHNYRVLVAILLLIVLFGLPFTEMNGNQTLLLDIIDRKFYIFGLVFTPQDTHIFALATVAFLVFIILFTFVFGRMFCGWVCPQTIFMEMVFRKIEYMIEGDARSQIKLNNGPWTITKIFKKGLKHFVFAVLSIVIINLLMSYIVGSKRMIEMISSPINEHFGIFLAMAILSAIFYFVFAFFREQVCTNVCPYGRMQGVLLVDDSIIVQYDFARGENRGSMKDRKNNENPSPSLVERLSEDMVRAKQNRGIDVNKWGDCIDCNQCVEVCPTGIDIRNGTQLECVNCTACIDACNDVMKKMEKPLGLIRLDSFNGVITGKDKLITKRGYAYIAVLVAILTAFGIVFAARTNVDAIILRTPGMTFIPVNENEVSNLYNYKFINRANQDYSNLEIKLVGLDGEIEYIGGKIPVLKSLQRVSGSFFVKVSKTDLKGQSTPLRFEVYNNDEKLESKKSNFLGPIK
ncbi:MAG TPA: cytochrome c oxidase accessory protein CcoG [Cytophagales bacterium]|nr:cytochrome c oxidase accessory protein CcoG [Cytophagales bacterium]